MFWNKKEKPVETTAPAEAVETTALTKPAIEVPALPPKAAAAGGVFISYRRSSALITDHVHEKVTTRLAGAPVFLDRNDIEPGAAFPARLRDAVSSASIVLVIIGRDWISAQDERTFRRRLDMPNDWVRQEVEAALGGDALVIPVLVEGIPMPTAEQLPDSIVALSEKNAITLSRDHFNEDVNKLIDFLAARLPRRANDGENGVKFPEPAVVRPVPLSPEQLAHVLKSLPQWRVSETHLNDDPRFGVEHRRVELVREFRFKSFKSAIDFMRAAADIIDAHGHHPRWENVFRTVTVWLSTWDIGHRPSDRDWKAAQMLEDIYKKYASQDR
ncbi:MAG: 4a-hydroxytetrahydrobiopterin dehydratase [Hyphomonadaceae bacterium]|nr:4a-hydroxytetrahydrobiopterin dehydratase [Hyphomonadaceae bacterium]